MQHNHESKLGTSVVSGQKLNERIQDESLPKNLKNGLREFFDTNREDLEKVLDDPFYYQKALDEHVINLYQEYFPTLPKIQFTIYNGGELNMSTKIKGNQATIFIPEKFYGFYGDILVILSCMDINLRQQNRKCFEDNCLTLLFHIDTTVKARTPTANTNRKIIKYIGELGEYFNILANLECSIFAFVICHELSHIVLNHYNENIDIKQRECEADSLAYIMFLKLIEQFRNGETTHPMAVAFQDYVAYAPMIFMRIP